MTIGLAVLASVPALALVSSQNEGAEGDFKASKSGFAYRSTSVGTSSPAFQPIAGLDDLEILGRDAATATFSGDFSGAPVEVRVVHVGGDALEPGTASFGPDEDATSFSHDFVMPGGRGVACRTLAVEWRSPTGGAVTLNHGSLIVDYRFDDMTKDGLRVACPD
ncbi:MAG: hypothetical protein M3271_12290 [Actinomycetota bacterium]|nr:hypothetical protein [Actinomycetota bacterium]